MQLATLQRLLGETLTDPASQVPDNLLREIRADGIPPERQVGIYQANALGSLTRAIDKSYPVCRQILGERYFAQLSRGFALQYPASCGDLDDYGERFPDYLTARVDDRPELVDFTYLPDLARLEWLIKQAWLAPDSPEFNFDAFRDSLQRTPAEQHRLLVAPSLSLLVSDWPIDRLWSLHLNDKAPKTLPAEGPITLCICRNDNGVNPVRLGSSEQRVLGRIMIGRSLGELGNPTEKRRIALDALLPQMIDKGWICGFAVPTDQAD